MKSRACAVCSVDSSLSCSRCKLVSYCNKEHQSQDWENHKIACFPVKLQFNSDFNRKVYTAKHDIPSGAVIFTDIPVMIFPAMADANMKQTLKDKGNQGKVCMGCCNFPASRKCSRCQWPVCTQKCEDEPFHAKLECKIFAKKFKHLELEEVYFRGNLVRALMLKTVYPEKWDAFFKHAHRTTVPMDDPQIVKNKAIMIDFIHNACKLKEIDAATIVTTMEILETNLKRDSVKTTCSKLESNGNGVVWGCLPNVVSHPSESYGKVGGLEKFERYYFAMKDIKKGEALVASINDNILGTLERRQFIAKYLGYFCMCARCKDPTECGTYFSAVACECRPTPKIANSNVGYYLPLDALIPTCDWKCNNCPMTKTAAEIRAIVDSCLIAHEQSKDTFYSELQMRFMGALKHVNAAKNENRQLFSKEKQELDIFMEAIPKVMRRLYDRIEKKESHLHPNHHILVKERLVLLHGLFFYLQLNRKEKCVLDSVEVAPFAFPIDGFQFFDGVPELWCHFNVELRDSSTELLQLLLKVFPNSIYDCEILNVYITFSKLMILKESARLHQNFYKFSEDLEDWRESRKKIFQGLLRHYSLERVVAFRELLNKMDSQGFGDGDHDAQFFKDILENKI